MQISVTVPVCNERENIRPLHEALCNTLDSVAGDYEIVFANDGSSDGTADELDALAAEDPKVKIIHLRRNYGQTSALMAAIHYSSGDIIIPMDGDLQNDPADIPRLLEKLDEGFDVVSGWRRDRAEGAERKLPSQMANWLISKISGVKLHDYGCSLKAYRRDVIADVRLYGEMHRFIPVYASWEGARVTELVVDHHPRQHGKSKYGLNRAPRVLLDLVVVRFLGIALDRPIQFFGRGGLYSLAGAFAAGIWALYLKFFEDVSFIQTPLPVLIALLVICGILLIMIGLLAEVMSRTYFEASKRFPFSVKSTKNLEPTQSATDLLKRAG